MCQKHQHHCDEYCKLREEAVSEWCEADSLSGVLATWGRMGGRVTLHRHGKEHYQRIGRMGALAKHAKERGE